MNEELAQYLLGLDKFVIENGVKQNVYLVDIQYPLNLRLTLQTPDDIDQSLLVDIKESSKQALRINLHHQDNGTQNGLLRIDYNGGHKNPEGILPTLPEIYKPFAGQYLDNYKGHIHYIVDGYKPLAWAIPLEIDTFPIKSLGGREDYIDTLKAFFKKINVKTDIQYNFQMRII